MDKHLYAGERPYRCHYCNKGFKDRETCKYHITIHTNIKPYKCGYCGRAFRQPSTLKTHEYVLLIHVFLYSS